jgi:hypothetical protein
MHTNFMLIRITIPTIVPHSPHSSKTTLLLTVSVLHTPDSITPIIPKRISKQITILTHITCTYLPLTYPKAHPYNTIPSSHIPKTDLSICTSSHKPVTVSFIKTNKVNLILVLQLVFIIIFASFEQYSIITL